MLDKDKLNEEMVELVRKIQAGDNDSFTPLLERIITTIKWFTHKKWKGIILKHNLGFEDVEQEMLATFIQCTYKFPDNHTHFLSYSINYIMGAALDYFANNTNRINKRDYSEGNALIVSADIKVFDDDERTVLDTLVDEKASRSFEKVIESIDRKIEREKLALLIRNIIPDINIPLLFDMYGIYGKHYSMQELCIKYKIKMQQLICWERMVILTLRKNKNLEKYVEENLYHIKLHYQMPSESKSEIETVKLGRVLKKRKKTELSGTNYVKYDGKSGLPIMTYSRKPPNYKFIK